MSHHHFMTNTMDICRSLYTLIMEHLNEILSLRSTGTLKSDNSFVSEGDLLCEKLVGDWIKNNVNNCLLISEESYHDISRLNKEEYVITVDPIDGTENFVSGLKEWGVGVSVYRKGTHYQSMIALPELDICLCTGDELHRIPRSRICGLSSYMTPEDFAQLGGGFEFRIMGCCMYNMYNVIHGSYAQFQHLKGCYSWDILPGMNLALEHGREVFIDGKPYKGEFLLPGIKYKFLVK